MKFLEENFAVGFDFLAAFANRAHHGFFVGVLVEFHFHLEQHEVDCCLLHACGLPCGVFHLLGANRAIDGYLVAFFIMTSSVEIC